MVRGYLRPQIDCCYQNEFAGKAERPFLWRVTLNGGQVMQNDDQIMEVNQKQQNFS